MNLEIFREDLRNIKALFRAAKLLVDDAENFLRIGVESNHHKIKVFYYAPNYWKAVMWQWDTRSLSWLDINMEEGGRTSSSEALSLLLKRFEVLDCSGAT